MAMQTKKIVVILFCFCIFLQKITAQPTESKSTAIAIADNAAHIAAITNNAIVLIAGSTYSFTVDTHPDSGLVSTTATAAQLLKNIKSKYSITQQYKVVAKNGVEKKGNELMDAGDQLIVTSADGKKQTYRIGLRKLALNGYLQIAEERHTVGAVTDIVLNYRAGQRSPFATVNLHIPAGIKLTEENTMINIIGRGDVLLKNLPQQSIGRVGTKYSYKQVGQYTITKLKDGTTVLSLTQLDLRPANGADVKIILKNIKLNHAAVYRFRASYKTSQPEKLQSAGNDYAVLKVTNLVSDLQRVVNRDSQFKETDKTYTTVSLKWNNKALIEGCRLMQSTDSGKTWQQAAADIDTKRSVAVVSQLHANRFYRFRLMIPSGLHKGLSNEVHYYSGKLDVKHFSAKGDGRSDDTEAINTAIRYLNQAGGGTLLFTKGEYNVRTVQLKSNVWLYISNDAKLQAIKGADAPESTWFSDKQYRSGLSPTDVGPYADPENYLTKQDVGHHYFHNTMFFAEREDNIKIIGNGLITGNGNLVTGDKVMNNAPDNRADKMFTFKLCTNIEIGGIYRGEDLWYDADKDEPYYITHNGTKDSNTSNMLQIDRAGHFVLLATGTDHIYVHNTYFAK
ncbi:MAG: endopygalactorunase, partial [Chitinophagaceae bacterium]|nr:endopygalactorunase [Chitinophagaceae bacterium]